MEIHTSTPIVCDKLLPPPSGRLWSNDSVTERLYQNRWLKYRNSTEEVSWGRVEGPQYVDFENIPEPRDSFFDCADASSHATPKRTLEKRLPGLDTENNNIIESLSHCALSGIRKTDKAEIGTENQISPVVGVAVNSIYDFKESPDESSNSTLLTDNAPNEMEIEGPKPPDEREFKNDAEDNRYDDSKVEKKNRSNSSFGNSTIVEPFSFEFREKCKREHRQARRERDSMGKEVFKGFRANPVPKYLKLREKNTVPATKSEEKRKMSRAVMHKLQNAAEIWKKKAFQPSHPKRVPVQPKPPQLFTAIRARERQRFEDQLREKERQRQVALKREEAERKRREDEELVKLRRQLVHKAQPIRRYKLIPARVEKRPLNDPTAPITCKRPRKL